MRGSVEAQFMLREIMVNDKLHGSSLMTLQSLFIVLVCSWRRLTNNKPLPAIYKPMVLLIVFLCVMRAWLYSERLAVIEILLPWVITRFAGYSGKPVRLYTLAPFFGVGLLFVLFSIGEYFRSWQFYQSFGGTFLEFSWTRMVGYYATALNNGAAALSLIPTPYTPENTLLFFYRLPFWSLFNIPSPVDSDNWMNFLNAYGSPEYNNSSGIFVPMMDFGIWLGLPVWFLMGLLSGKLANAYRKGAMLGVLLYPIWFIGITEILRIFYWTSDRVFYLLVAGTLISFYLSRRAIYPDMKSS